MAQFLKDEVKEKIKRSAVDVFTDKGFQQASIKAIAQHAQVSVGNVYNYYANKEALYDEVIKSVDEGIVEILKTVEKNDNYRRLLDPEVELLLVNEPMIMFMHLYKKERKVFEMLLTNGRDRHYEATIVRIINVLKVYFQRFWGGSETTTGLSRVEISGLTNGLVFGVCDMLNQLEDDEMSEDQLMAFVVHMIRGYFLSKQMEDDNQ